MSKIKVLACPICGSEDLQHFLDVKDHSISGESFELVQCTVCDLKITQDHPDLESIGPYYQSEDYISHSDTSKGLINSLYHTVRGYMLNQKRKIVQQQQKGGRLLDFGTGTAYFANHMKEHGWEVTGMEPDPGAREHARTTFGLNIEEPSAVYEKEDESFDVITMWHVMEHIHMLKQDMQQIARILKPSGTLVIAVPNPTSSDARKYGASWAAYDVPRHLWHFAPKSVHKLLTDLGLELLETKGMPFDAFYVSMLSEKYRGASLGSIKGGLTGTVTNMKSLSSTTEASSLIYVAKKKA